MEVREQESKHRNGLYIADSGKLWTRVALVVRNLPTSYVIIMKVPAVGLSENLQGLYLCSVLAAFDLVVLEPLHILLKESPKQYCKIHSLTANYKGIWHISL